MSLRDLSLTVALLLCAANAQAQTRIDLSVGQLCLPEGYRAVNGKAALLVHLHGTSERAERAVAESGRPAVVVTVALKGLSRVYSDQFADPAVFRGLLDETTEQLRRFGVAQAVGVVTVSSFSAGFGGVRELLKHEDLYQRIDALVMADSIYAGFTGEPALRKVDPANMTGFLRFARDAVERKKSLVITTCEIRPDNYASTVETADYLLSELGGKRDAVDEEWQPGWRCTSRYRAGRFQLYSFAGDTGPDHLKHLYNLGRLLKLATKEKP